jgi:hypothetical protein
MQAEAIDGVAVATDRAAAPKYLRALTAVSRSPRKGEYLVILIRSGSFYRTDRLGAKLARAMISGKSNIEALELIDHIEAGSSEWGQRLIYALEAKGALATSRPASPPPLRLRLVAYIAGPVLGAVGPIVRIMPPALLASLFRKLLSLGSGGSAPSNRRHRPRQRRSFNYAFMYLTLCLPPERVGKVINRLFDRAAADEVADRVKAEGPTVAAFLRGPLCPAVPNVLRARGLEVVRIVPPLSHGVFVSRQSGQLVDFFGETPQMLVRDTGRLFAGELLRHLQEGRSVYVGLDNILHVRDPKTGTLSKPQVTAVVEMLGRRFPRNDFPAMLATRSGRPLVLWTTHDSAAGCVISASPPLYPDSSLPMADRIAELSKALYRYAEAAIHEHADDWRYFAHINLMTVDQPPPG